MDSAKLILTGEVTPPLPLGQLSESVLSKKMTEWESAKIEGDSTEDKAQAAKAFEAVFINKLLEAMKDTIGEWGLEKDGVSKQIHGLFSLYLAQHIADNGGGVSKQIHGLFSLYLAQHIADNGGFGLWREIYRSLTDSSGAETTAEAEIFG
jgi:Rod binding domain-containing protein